MNETRMKAWYRDYWAQTWYTNTFLVRRPRQIAQTVDNDRDWNNVYDSGCNFTCIAMIVGIDPAYLASTLSTQRFFYADSELMGQRLSGKRGGLVWDQNAPNTEVRNITLTNLWHPRRRCRVTVTLRYVDVVATRTYFDAVRVVTSIRAAGGHVVCGTDEHSHLVAGTVGSDFALWDPDETVVDVETNLSGQFTLRQLFQNHLGEVLEFWHYKCDISEQRSR
jgi:hypothetical protein